MSKLSPETLSAITLLLNHIVEIDKLIDKLKGPKELICGMCYKSIDDHEEYPTEYCYPALQCWVYLSESTKGGDPRYPLRWNTDKERII